MLNLGWEMSVIRIFEWHYLYKFTEYFKYKDQFPACSTWAWTNGVVWGGIPALRMLIDPLVPKCLQFFSSYLLPFLQTFFTC